MNEEKHHNSHDAKAPRRSAVTDSVETTVEDVEEGGEEGAEDEILAWCRAQGWGNMQAY